VRLLSRTANVKYGTPQDLVRFDEGQPGQAATWTLRLQAQGASPITITVQTATGDSPASFTRSFLLLPGPVRTLRLQGHLVLVSAAQTNAAIETTTQVSGTLSPGDSDSLGDVVTSLVSGNTPAAQAVAVSGAGTFLSAQGSCVALGSGDTQYWLMLFDQNTTPVTAGAAPLLAIGPLVANTPFSADYNTRPAVFFGTGLTWALSTTAGTYTAPGSGAEARVDIVYGQ
jgi:hypothetical protein